MLIKKLDKNCCMFRITKSEIQSVGWDLNEIEHFERQSESLSKMIGFLMNIFSSHVDPDFLAYAKSTFNGVPLCVEGCLAEEFIDFRIYIPLGCEDVFHLEPELEVRPLHTYLSEYRCDGYEDECDSEECEEEYKGDEVKAEDEAEEDDEDEGYYCVMSFNGLNDVISFCKVVISSKLPDFNSRLFKVDNQKYALICCFPSTTTRQMFTAYSFVTSEFASNMEYNNMKAAYIAEHKELVIKEKAITKLASI